jgi:hypothetical protein
MRRRERLAKLRRLALRSGDAGPRQAAELLRGLADGKLWRGALGGCGLSSGEPVLGSFFAGPKSTLATRRAAWLTIVGAAPADVPMDATLLAPKALRFTEWRLERWPGDALPRFATVEALTFDRCWLAALPGFVLHLTKLHELTIERARLTEPLPEALWQRPLRAVRIEHAWLDRFPTEAAAGSLERLSLIGNRITTLPADLGRRFEGTALDLRANPLTAEARRLASAAGASC